MLATLQCPAHPSTLLGPSVGKPIANGPTLQNALKRLQYNSRRGPGAAAANRVDHEPARGRFGPQRKPGRQSGDGRRHRAVVRGARRLRTSAFGCLTGRFRVARTAASGRKRSSAAVGCGSVARLAASGPERSVARPPSLRDCGRSASADLFPVVDKLSRPASTGATICINLTLQLELLTACRRSGGETFG